MAQGWEYGIVNGMMNPYGYWLVNAAQGQVPQSFTNAAGHNDLDKYLSALGDEGWELVAVVGDPQRASLFLKKPKP